MMSEPMPDAMKRLIDLKGMTPREIERFCRDALRQREGQGLRIAVSLFRKRRESIDGMEDINRAFRSQVKECCWVSSTAVEKIEDSADGTRKLLYRLDDGNIVEGVLIPGPDRMTLCVSTQVGCASGCSFCLTGNGGFLRNLTRSEIVNQVFAAERTAGKPVANIVLMGSGEPLNNYDAVRGFIEIATGRHGMGFSPKKVTISTCGVAPMIERLADDRVAASLAVSLNAVTDEVRNRIMPLNRTWPLERVLRSLRYYTERSGKHVTVEYVLFRGVNDADEDAKRLCELLEGLPCMVNLLLFNPFLGSSFERPDDERVSAFRDILVRGNLVTIVRRSRGRDISAACGQLKAAAAGSKEGQSP
jgi:23S rRNA (adenine2503-C2)-methyltransferase